MIVADSDLQAVSDAMVSHNGNKAAAAESLGIPRSTFQDRLKLAARRGFSQYYDQSGVAPPGFSVKGKSIYNPDTQTWVKTSRDWEQQQIAMEAAVQALKEEVPRARSIKAPKIADTDLAVQYTITDYHFGQLSWGEETGEDWDTHIAENLLTDWFSHAIQSAPDAHTGIFAQLGDLIHYDSLDAVTPASKNLLDSDTRYNLLVRVVVRSMRRVIRMLLEKHQHVVVLMAEGNHDTAGSVWLRETFASFYEDEPRLTVETSPRPFYCIEWGDVSLFYHHGHKVKFEKMSKAFMSEFREVYGRTRKSYAHCGHLHHYRGLEDGSMKLEQHPTLASRDAFASRLALNANRAATAIVYHKRYGEFGRASIPPEMVREAA